MVYQSDKLRRRVFVWLSKKRFTLEKVVNDDGFSIIGIEGILIDFGSEDLSKGFVGFEYSDDEKRIGDRDEVEIGEFSAADEELKFLGLIIAHHGSRFIVLIVGIGLH